MIAEPNYLIDASSARIGTLNTTWDNGVFRGTICLDAAPPQLKRLFEEFEENVEGQMFNLADEIEKKISSLKLRIVFANGQEAPVEDLQVFPSTGRVSFKVGQLAGAKRAAAIG
jgi:hypothetical protein